jgi:EAL domain-containing protein (putative c-di-GMP-specific phosphodiesterase class I)
MHNLAELSIDGVKLDRSFAMAPDHSVMARMLDHAIDLVQASGRSLVVEGVETRERLDALKATGVVDFAQGYAIARPLLIDAYVAYLAEHGPRPVTRPRLVA